MICALILASFQSGDPKFYEVWPGAKGTVYAVAEKSQRIMVFEQGAAWKPLLSPSREAELEGGRAANDPESRIEIKLIQDDHYILGELEVWHSGATLVEVSQPFAYNLKSKRLTFFPHVSQMDWVGFDGKVGYFNRPPYAPMTVEYDENPPPTILCRCLPDGEPEAMGAGVGLSVDAKGRLFAAMSPDGDNWTTFVGHEKPTVRPPTWTTFSESRRTVSKGELLARNGSCVVYRNADGTVFLRNADGRIIKVPIDFSEGGLEPTVSANGWVFYPGTNSQLWHPDRADFVHMLPGRDEFDWRGPYRLSFDGWLFNLNDGENVLREKLPDHPREDWHPRRESNSRPTA